MTTPTAGLDVTGLGLAVGDRRLFEDTSISVGPGRTAAIMGPSGSGKTSFLNAVAGLVACTGVIRLHGETVSGLRPREWDAFRLRRIGMVFQDSDLLPELTAVENAELPGRLMGREKHEYRARALETLSDVGLESRRDSWPSELSGGERQRVAVARALHHRPGILLADEPTGALDQENRDRVVALIVDIARSTGAVALIATHDPAVAARCDATYWCRGSRLVCDDAEAA